MNIPGDANTNSSNSSDKAVKENNNEN